MLHTLLLTLSTFSTTSDWTALELPALCEERASTSFPALLAGTHMSLEESLRAKRTPVTSALIASDVASLLGNSSRAAGVELNLFPYSPPLLAQGEPAALDWAREELQGLERAASRQQISLEVLLFPGELSEEDARTQLSGATAGTTSLPPGAQLWRRNVQPGETTAFGERERFQFLANYAINVATDSGVAAPQIGSVFSGKTLHLTASRVERGARVHVRGWLDLAEAGETREFDPHSPDLGRLEQPQINSLSLGFSGVTNGSSALHVSIAGAPLEQQAWTLFVFAGTSTEPEQLQPHDWLALDVSLLSREGQSFDAFGPGAGLSEDAQLGNLRTLADPISTAGIVSAAEPRTRNSRSGAGATRPASHIGDALILLSSARVAQDEGNALGQLVSAMESTRLTTDRVSLQHGDLRVEFPVAEGEPARLIVGHERSLLVGYEAEIAPNTWMPAPMVERSFDGLAWQGRRESGAFRTSAWISATDSVEERARDEANMGALQLPKRRLRESAAALAETGSTVLLRSQGSSAALLVSLGSH